MTLAELQSAIAADVFHGRNLHAMPTELCLSQGDPSHVEACNHVVTAGVLWFDRERPTRCSAKSWMNCREAIEANIVGRNERGELVCGFGIIIGAILSWIIGQALSALWRWWKGRRDSTNLICGMAAECAA